MKGEEKQYVDCPDCKGKGYEIVENYQKKRVWGMFFGNTQLVREKEECFFCWGEGKIEFVDKVKS